LGRKRVINFNQIKVSKYLLISLNSEVLFDEKGEVRAGNLNQLIIYLTSPTCLSGSTFFNTFMGGLQTFSTPLSLVQKLQERFLFFFFFLFGSLKEFFFKKTNE